MSHNTTIQLGVSSELTNTSWFGLNFTQVMFKRRSLLENQFTLQCVVWKHWRRPLGSSARRDPAPFPAFDCSGRAVTSLRLELLLVLPAIGGTVPALKVLPTLGTTLLESKITSTFAIIHTRKKFRICHREKILQFWPC